MLGILLLWLLLLAMPVVADECSPVGKEKVTQPSKEVSKPDFGPYMGDMQRRIKQTWSPPKGFRGKRVVVKFKLARDGTIRDISILESSGMPIADKSAIHAVEKAVPFRHLPESSPDEVDIQFTFDDQIGDFPKEQEEHRPADGC